MIHCRELDYAGGNDRDKPPAPHGSRLGRTGSHTAENPGPDRWLKMLDEQQTITVRVRFFASARAAAGVDSEHLQLAPAASVRDALERLRDAHPGRLDEILRAASFLVDGVAVRDPAMPLPAGAQLDVLPPFAGG